MRKGFFKNHVENEEGKLVPDLFLFFKKVLYKTKASAQHITFNIFWYTLTWTNNKNKLSNRSRDMLDLDFLWKSLGLASPQYFSVCFFKKSTSHVITDQISLAGFVYFLRC